MKRVLYLATVLVLFVNVSLGQPSQTEENSILRGITSVGIAKLIIPASPVGWYYEASGSKIPETAILPQKSIQWRGKIREAIKVEVAKSGLALETTVSQFERMGEDNEHPAPILRPEINVYKGWFQIRIELEQAAQLLRNGQDVGAVTYETSPLTGRLGKNPKESLIQGVRSKVREFVRDWKAQN